MLLRSVLVSFFMATNQKTRTILENEKFTRGSQFQRSQSTDGSLHSYVPEVRQNTVAEGYGGRKQLRTRQSGDRELSPHQE